jgi:hypothetical protein
MKMESRKINKLALSGKPVLKNAPQKFTVQVSDTTMLI